jgi:L-ascorbate metabolism protein UlaG (beta-lactamase superfamily)
VVAAPLHGRLVPRVGSPAGDSPPALPGPPSPCGTAFLTGGEPGPHTACSPAWRAVAFGGADDRRRALLRIHTLRNATLVLVSGSDRILVDPMLGPKGSLAPIAYVRHRPRRNPLVDLPPGSHDLLEGVTAGLITHCRFGHVDHLDRPGARLLSRLGVPVFCSRLDQAHLARRRLRTVPLKPGRSFNFLGGKLTPFRAVHGYGAIGWLMGPGLGYLIEMRGEPSLYISGDTVLTDEVRRVLVDHRPDVAVVAAGIASLDVGRPILMPLEEILEFVRLAPGLVIANHLEAINHCPMTRERLRRALDREGLSDKVRIPEDGAVVEVG